MTYLTFFRRVAKFEATKKMIEYSIMHKRHPSGRRSYHLWFTLSYLDMSFEMLSSNCTLTQKEAQVRLLQVVRALTIYATVEVKLLLAASEVLIVLLFS